MLHYACEIWGKCKPVPIIEKVLLRYLKYMLGVKDGTCSVAVYGETGCYPVYIYQIIKTIKYWHRITTLSSSELVKKAYDVSKSLCLSGFNSWACKIRCILEKYDMCNVWDNECEATNYMDFNKYFKDCVFDNYVQQWEKELSQFPVLRSYVSYKQAFGLENYLLQLQDRRLRKVLSQFRLSSHRLQIEVGRHHKPKIPVEKRICILCNANCIEDEEHLLLHCSFYHEERVHLFCKIIENDPTIFDNDNATNVFISILSSVNADVIFSLSKFLYKCFRKRNNFLT